MMKNLDFLLEKTRCNFCGKVNSKLLFHAIDRQYDSVPPDIWCDVVKCKNCGLIYLSPRVKEEYIEKFYPENEYYTRKQANSGKLRKRKEDLFKMVACLYFGYSENAIKFESEFNHIGLLLLAKIVFKFFPFKYRQILPYTRNGRLLDFGFGSGDYLRRMKNLGWKCWGVEKDKKAIEEMNKKQIPSFLDLWDSKIPENYFDWVNAYHSIEHTHKPKLTIQRIFNILKSGGKFYIGLPNFNSLNGRIFRSYWYNLSTPIHPYVFTKNSIINFLKDSGFTEIKIYYRSLAQGILGSIQNIINAFISHLTKKKYTKMFLRDNLLLRLLFLPIVKIVDYLKLGDRIEIIATKK